MDDLVTHMKWVEDKTVCFPPEGFTPDDTRFEAWHVPFFKTMFVEVSQPEAIARLEKEGIEEGNIRMMVYWWDRTHCPVDPKPPSPRPSDGGGGS
jgi:hypothetical protein